MREGLAPPPGEMLTRQPGAMAVWVTRSYRLFGDGAGGVLVRIGDPSSVAWYAHGRPATRAEVVASIESGVPHLAKLAAEEGPDAVAALEQALTAAWAYLPAEAPSSELLRRAVDAVH